MDSLTRDDLRTLIESEGEWCVSIFMPTVRAGAEAQQNPIRYRNLLKRAEERLVQFDMRVPDAERLLRPAQDLLDNTDLWRHTSDGLAVFVADGHFSVLRLSRPFEEAVYVKRRFYIKPLLPLLNGDGQFYVLALSQDQVRLLEGSRESVSTIDLKGVPTSLAQALQKDEPQLQMRTAGRAASGGSAGSVYYGQGGSGDEKVKADLVRYCQVVDHGLRSTLADKHSPLVLAGVDYLLPIYQEANSYSHIVAQGVIGNPDLLSAKELHQRAWEIVKPFFEQTEAEQRTLYETYAGRSDAQASNDFVTVIKAAHEGRIAALFIPKGMHQWGQYRAHSHKVHAHPSEQPGDQDLLDLAAAQTFASGGMVYVVEPDAVPGGEMLAAVFRY